MLPSTTQNQNRNEASLIAKLADEYNTLMSCQTSSFYLKTFTVRIAFKMKYSKDLTSPREFKYLQYKSARSERID